MKKAHRGVSFGTVFMLAMTVVVLGASWAVLPRLLGRADFDVQVNRDFAALTLNNAMPALAMHDIPLSGETPVPQSPLVTAELVQSATPTPIPTPTPFPGTSITLTLGGSVNIDDAIRKSAYYNDSGKYDFTEIMSLLKDEMTSDLTLVTLENVTDDASKVSAVNAPSVVFDMLADAGVDIVALGHPKAYDQGMEGLQATIQAAKERNLIPLGTCASETEANDYCLINVECVRIAFLHYTESISSAGKKAMNNDKASYALAAMLVNGTEDAMLNSIRKAREEADVVIVSLNWGSVSASKPTKTQQTLAQQIAEAGADVIIGAGSRVVQPVTWLTSKTNEGNIRQTLCAWSLGSILNESRKDGNVLGMLLQLQLFFDGDSISFEKVCYTPTYIWRYKQDGQYQYRVAVSDQIAPDGMGDEQEGFMQKALRNLQKYLGDSPVTLRSK